MESVFIESVLQLHLNTPERRVRIMNINVFDVVYEDALGR